jgi:Asp-tRNAAsn/Glu-tRNAGln amidotransferase A subunit and related amidases
VKDAIDVAGTVTTVGARSREDSGVAQADAPCVAAIRRSGGRIVGKTNLSELCWFADGVNEHTGTPVNPLDASRAPGGSSSGSAVVVALGEADVALGTDTGGSVRIPAACCGIAGLKTTHGRVPLDGVFPLAPELDTVGPLARDVAGLVTAMRLLEPDFVPTVPATGRQPMAVRLRVDVHVELAVDAAVDSALADARWEVRDLVLAGWQDLVLASVHILNAGAAIAHGFLLDRPDLLGDRARRTIELCLQERPEDVARARVLLAGLQRDLSAALSAADVLVLPTLTDAPPRFDHAGKVGLTTLTIPFNVLGWPAVSVPAYPARAGVIPPSVQLIGPLGSEELLLGLAAQLPSQRT